MPNSKMIICTKFKSRYEPPSCLELMAGSFLRNFLDKQKVANEIYLTSVHIQ